MPKKGLAAPLMPVEELHHSALQDVLVAQPMVEREPSQPLILSF